MCRFIPQYLFTWKCTDMYFGVWYVKFIDSSWKISKPKCFSDLWFLSLWPFFRCVQPRREGACFLPSQMPIRRWWSWVWPSLQCVGASRASYFTTLTVSERPTVAKLLHLVSLIWPTSGHDSRWVNPIDTRYTKCLKPNDQQLYWHW